VGCAKHDQNRLKKLKRSVNTQAPIVVPNEEDVLIFVEKMLLA
jgi:hypothetical protein